MELGLKILSEVNIFNKYAKHIPSENRRETWEEIVERYSDMMIEKYPQLKKEIFNNKQFIIDKKVLPSMRGLQFAGIPIKKNNTRIYNCCYLPIDDYHAFSETLFLLLGGTGVGYSVQKHHVAKLPVIKYPTKTQRYIVPDTIEGWSDAVKMLMKAYLGYTDYKPRFDYCDIRPKGSPLKSTGGTAPGHKPLQVALEKIEQILLQKVNGEQLKPIEVHDIICHLADSVLTAGIRRSACISLFSFDDEEMITCKSGNWWENNLQRSRANNSVVLERDKISEKQFKDLWKKIEDSNSGEPGFYWTNDRELGTNPCCEISLKPFQMCNLCEVNVSDIVSQEDLNQRVSIASFFGTLQAGFTDFHYLRPIWKETTEAEALIGVGQTGIASGEVLNYNLKGAANIVKEINEVVADIIRINKAARTTTVKPSGTSSCVLGTSSGIHAWYDEYYIRTLRLLKSDPLATYLTIYYNEFIEDDVTNPDQIIFSIPQIAPKGSILRTESALDLLERVKKFNVEWIKEGHRVGDNTNNVSATISIDKDNEYWKDITGRFWLTENCEWKTFNEWEVVGEWMWNNKEFYNGLSVLPYDTGSYRQAPFQAITKEKYEEMIKSLKDIDLTKVVELNDNTNFGQEIACSGGTCEVLT